MPILIDVRYCIDNVDELLAPSPSPKKAVTPSKLLTISPRSRSSLPSPSRPAADLLALLPAEVVLHILSYVDAETLVQCIGVSKA